MKKKLGGLFYPALIIGGLIIIALLKLLITGKALFGK